MLILWFCRKNLIFLDIETEVFKDKVLWFWGLFQNNMGGRSGWKYGWKKAVHKLINLGAG